MIPRRLAGYPAQLFPMKIQISNLDPKIITGPADDPELGLPARSHHRCHLSQVYGDIEQTLGVQKVNHFDDRELELYRSIGFVWERAIAQSMASGLVAAGVNWFRPGEVELDDIVGSPDLWEVETCTVIDTKATYRSARKLDNLEKYFWTWLVQLKGYCQMMATHDARLVVMCVNGDYAPPAPRLYQIDLSFNDRELIDNWSMITRHARKRGWIK